MKINYGKGRTEYGPGIDINLTGDEVACAIGTYLVAHNVHISGPRTIRVNGELCEGGNVYVDPSGFVIADGIKYSGRGPTDMAQPDDPEDEEERPGTVIHPHSRMGRPLR